MPVITIVGAGPGMGLAIAKTFGRQDHKVALVSRNADRRKLLLTTLAEQGIEAEGFTADVRSRESVVSCLAEVKQRFGSIDVLEYSPVDQGQPLTSITDVTHDSLQAAFDLNVHGALSAIQAVLPDMLARGTGTILITTGASSVYPHLGSKKFANLAVAGAALRAYAHALHAALAPHGVQVGLVAIGVWIGQQPGTTPDAISPLYWELHTKRDQVERIFSLEAPGVLASGTRNLE